MGKKDFSNSTENVFDDFFTQPTVIKEREVAKNVENKPENEKKEVKITPKKEETKKEKAPKQAEIVKEQLSRGNKLLAEHGYRPYYLYRQKHMVADFENIGYSKNGCECLYNIMIMEETNSIVSVGCGGVTKIVNLPNDRIERVFNVKEAMDYVTRIDEMCKRKDVILEWLN